MSGVWSEGYSKPDNVTHVALGIAAAVFSVTFLRRELPSDSAVVVGLIDGYLLCLLFGAALVADGCSTIRQYMPRRVPCLILFACLLTAVLLSFANIYLHCNVRLTSARCVPNCHDVAAPLNIAASKTGKLESSADAIYFSAMTLTTLGYVDYAPQDELARGMVLWELGTGMLMIVLLFPLLVCRIAIFEGKGELCASAPLPKALALDWKLKDLGPLLGGLLVFFAVVLVVMWVIWRLVR